MLSSPLLAQVCGLSEQKISVSLIWSRLDVTSTIAGFLEYAALLHILGALSDECQMQAQ